MNNSKNNISEMLNAQYNFLNDWTKSTLDFQKSFIDKNNHSIAESFNTDWDNTMSQWNNYFMYSVKEFSTTESNPFLKNYNNLFKNNFQNYSHPLNQIMETIYLQLKNIHQIFDFSNAEKINFSEVWSKQLLYLFNNFDHLFTLLNSYNSDSNPNASSSNVNILAPLIHLFSQMKGNETLSIYLNDIPKFNLLMNGLFRMYYLINNANHSAMNKSMEWYSSLSSIEKIESKNKSDLITEWISLNEKVYIELFASEEFSKTKAELINTALQIKKNMEHQVEHHFSNTPFVFRTEMDALYKTIHELKNKVKKVEAQLNSEKA